MPYYIVIGELIKKEGWEKQRQDQVCDWDDVEKEKYNDDPLLPVAPEVDNQQQEGQSFLPSVLLAEERVSSVLRRLIDTDIVWVIDESLIDNAWTDGESIVITRRFVDKLNEDELAFVISHEMAHMFKKHVAQNQESVKVFCDHLGDYWDDADKGKLRKVFGSVILVGLFVPLTLLICKGQEFDADAAACVLMGKAGFNSAAAQNVLEYLNGGESGRTGVFKAVFSKHPSLQSRIDALPKTSL